MGYIITNLRIIVSLIVVNFFQTFAITTRLNRDFSSSGGHPINLGTLSIPDWELGLREAIFRALTSENSVRVKNLKEYIYQAPLVGRQNYASPFGDIAIIARGQLYSAPGGFELLQDLYQNDCDGCHNKPPKCGRVPCENWKPYDHERLLALWTVKRIRHRDSKYGYRYEFEYKISPMSMVLNERFVTRNGNFDYSVTGRSYLAQADPEQTLDNSLNRNPNQAYDDIYDPYEEPNWNAQPDTHYLPPPIPTSDEFYDSDPRKPGYPGGLYEPPPRPQPTTEKDVSDKDFEKELFKDSTDIISTKSTTSRQTTNFTKMEKVTMGYTKTTVTPKMYKRITTEIPFLPTVANERKSTTEQTEQNESAQETTISTQITPILNATQVGDFYFQNVTLSTSTNAATPTARPYQTKATRRTTKKPPKPNIDDFDIFGDDSDTITKTTPKIDKSKIKEQTLPKPFSTFQSEVFDQPTTKKIISSTSSTFKNKPTVKDKTDATTPSFAQNDLFGKPTISSPSTISTRMNTIDVKDETTARSTTGSVFEEAKTKLPNSSVKSGGENGLKLPNSKSGGENGEVPEIRITPPNKVTTPKIPFGDARTIKENEVSFGEQTTTPQDDIFGGPISGSTPSGIKKASSKNSTISNTYTTPQSEFDNKINSSPGKVTSAKSFPATSIMRPNTETPTNGFTTTKFQNSVTKTTQVQSTPASNLETTQNKKTTGTQYLTFPTTKMVSSTVRSMIYSIPLSTTGHSTNEIVPSYTTENSAKVDTTSATDQTSNTDDLTSFSLSTMIWPTTADFRPSTAQEKHKNVPGPSIDQKVGTQKSTETGITSTTKMAVPEEFLTFEDEAPTISVTSPQVSKTTKKLLTTTPTSTGESGKSTTEELEIIYPVTKATSPKFSVQPVTKLVTSDSSPLTVTTKMVSNKPKLPMVKPTLSTTYLPAATNVTRKPPLDIPPIIRTTKPKAKTTSKPRKTNSFDDDLFGDPLEDPLPKRKGKTTTARAISRPKDVDDIFAFDDEVVQKSTKRPLPEYNYIDNDIKPPKVEPKIIYSDFYSPSTATPNVSENSFQVTKLDTTTEVSQKVTKQSLSTSVSYKVNKKDRSTTPYIVQSTTNFDVTTETEMPNNEELTINKSELIKIIQKMCNTSRSEADSKALDALALTVLNNAKSITYLKASQDRAALRSKYKRRNANKLQRNRRPP